MSKITTLTVDIVNNSIKLNAYPAIVIPKCKGILILNFLNQHIDKPFSPTLLRMNIENNQDMNLLQDDEFSCLIDQACDYIPATDRQAIKEVLRELKSNATAIQVAREHNNESEVEYLIEQNEILSDYLHKAMNFNHTIRNITQTRTNDTKSIKRALHKLIMFAERKNPEVAKIISRHLKISSSSVGLLSTVL